MNKRGQMEKYLVCVLPSLGYLINPLLIFGIMFTKFSIDLFEDLMLPLRYNIILHCNMKKKSKEPDL